MSEDNFLAQSLNSRQLLALLYICETKRKGTSVTLPQFQMKAPSEWTEILEAFAARFTNLAETMRFEVLEAHLMSVEDLDVYNDETLKKILDENRALLSFLTQELDRDPRFQLEP